MHKKHMDYGMSGTSKAKKKMTYKAKPKAKKKMTYKSKMKK